VPKTEGWILVSIPDPAPGKDISDLRRSDGVHITKDNAWRSNGMVTFVDDPDVTYVLAFQEPPSTHSEDGGNWFTPNVGVVALIAALAAVALIMHRRRID
jgi:hypothetical protein